MLKIKQPSTHAATKCNLRTTLCARLPPTHSTGRCQRTGWPSVAEQTGSQIFTRDDLECDGRGSNAIADMAAVDKRLIYHILPNGRTVQSTVIWQENHPQHYP
jgi:hypothetical protein